MSTNKTYIEATAQINIIDKFGHLVEETDWNFDRNIHYPDFDDSCSDEFEYIHYYDVLEFTVDEINIILENDILLKEDYQDCSFDLFNVHVVRVYNDNGNEINCIKK